MRGDAGKLHVDCLVRAGDGQRLHGVHEFRVVRHQPVGAARQFRTGQTTEVLALPGETDAFERVVGAFIPSYASASVSYHFGK